VWFTAGDQRLERYCEHVDVAKDLRAEALRVLQESGVGLPLPSEKPADLLRRYQELIKADSDAAWAYQLRGQIHAESGERDKAEADYQRAFELLAGRRGISLDDPQAVHDFAATALARRRWDVAIASLGRLLELGADYKRPQKDGLGTRVWPHHERGYAYGWLPDYEKAAAEYSKAIELAPGHADLWARRASIFFAQGEFEQALKDYSQAIELAPHHPSCWPWSDYIAVLLQLGRWPQAAAHFKGIAHAQPENANVAYQHALVLLGAGDLAGYRNLCGEIVQRFGNTSDIATAHWVAWTCALGPDALDDLSPAVAAAERAVSAQPNLQHLTDLGAVLCRAGRWSEAIQHLGEVERQTPEPSEASPSSPAYAWFFLAMAHDRLGSDAEAALWRAKASQYTEKAFESEASGRIASQWNRRLTLRLLRDEAIAAATQPATPTRAAQD
jgi:tetratricopeptide (TPR) repeat protein